MPQVPLQRWTDVALKREGGSEITKGAARLYGAVLVRETEGLLSSRTATPSRRIRARRVTITTRIGRSSKQPPRVSSARRPAPSKSGVPFIDSVNARRLFSSIPPACVA